MATTQALPPPYKGQNDILPEISIQNPYCIRMKNFNNDGGALQLRKGHKKFAQVNTDITQPLNIAAYGDELFLLIDDSTVGLRWYDVSSGTPVSVHTTVWGGDDEIHTLYFNGYLFYFGESGLSPGQSGPQYYNGSAWGAAGYTWSIGTPLGGAVYKNRAYFLDRGTTKYAYSEIDAISGATTTVDLATVISEKSDLAAIRSVSLSENVTQENVLAFIFSSGEILVYSGSYPDSASWQIISRLKVSPLLYVNSAIDAKGDTFLLTRSEILSLRNLIARGYNAEREEGIGAAVQDRWKQITAGIAAATVGVNYFFKGLYDEDRDRLIISVPQYVDPDTGVAAEGIFQFIYDFVLGAWYEYYQPDDGEDFVRVYSATYYEKGSYVMSYARASGTKYATVHKLDSETNYLDDDIVSGESGIEYEMLTAPLPIPKFGANAIDGVEAICKTDLYAQTNYKFIADLGRQSTSEQSISSQGTDVAKPMMNVGIQGAITVQLEISGTSVSSAEGLELYALNVWYAAGEKGSR